MEENPHEDINDFLQQRNSKGAEEDNEAEPKVVYMNRDRFALPPKARRKKVGRKDKKATRKEKTAARKVAKKVGKDVD